MSSSHYGNVKRSITTFEDVVKRYQNLYEAYSKNHKNQESTDSASHDKASELNDMLGAVKDNESKILKLITKQLSKMPSSPHPADKVFMDALHQQQEKLAQLKEKGTCHTAESKTEIDGAIVNVEIERFEKTGERNSKVYNNNFIIEISGSTIRAKNVGENFEIKNAALAQQINPILEQMLEGKFTQEEAEKFKAAFSLVTNALKNSDCISEADMPFILKAFADLQEEAAKGL